MSSTSAWAKVVIFLAGIATGWLLARGLSPQRPPTGANVSAPAELESETPEARTFDKSLWLTVEFDGGSTLVPAARIGDSDVLIASLYSVYPANSVHYLDADGEQVFPPVVAYDHVNNLIAFKDTVTEGFRVSGEDGSLFIGRDVALSIPGERLDGQVESALQTALNGRNYFNVAFTGSVSRRGGPLLNKDTDELIGFVTTMRGPPPAWMHLAGDAYSAVDATSIRSFLRTSLQSALNVRDFTASFARSPGGLRYSISRLAERQQWGSAVDALEALASIDSSNSDITQQALTLAAYYYGHQLIGNDDPSSALSLTSNMKQRFPQQQPWCLVESRAFASLLRWERAFDSARVCLQDPYGTRPRDSDLLASPARDALGRSDNKRAVLEFAHEAAIRFAAVTAESISGRKSVLLKALELGEHAQVYRLLGDFEYDAQNYAAAQSYYREAIRLDPSISASLGNRLRNSTQRANSGPATEIEYERRGGGIVVSARLNDSSQSFRLLVDTGATYSALSGGTLLRLGLDNVLNGVPQVVELEAAGGTIYAQRFVLDSMQIGNARVNQVPTVILENMEGFDGLVGLSFLQHFDVSLDQEAGKLILVPR